MTTDIKDTLDDRSGELVDSCNGFAGVHPGLKVHALQAVKKRGQFTGMTGDSMSFGAMSPAVFDRERKRPLTPKGRGGQGYLLMKWHTGDNTHPSRLH